MKISEVRVYTRVRMSNNLNIHDHAHGPLTHGVTGSLHKKTKSKCWRTIKF